MKLVNYTCTVCGLDTEEYFNDTEVPPDFLDEICDGCDSIGTILINNIKNNCHRWNYFDRNGSA